MRVKRPQGNAIVLAILRSPAHRLLSGMAIELRYTGRRSGRSYVLPVQYARIGDRLIVVPQSPEAKTWWRNFSAPRPVTLRLEGRLREGTARVIGPDEPGWAEARQVYARRWRRLAVQVSGPIVEIALD